MVPVGYKLELWEDSNQGGTKLEFEGQENEDGSLLCQDLGVLKNLVSDSVYSLDLAWALNNFSQEIDSLKQ